MYPTPPELNNHEISRFGELYVDDDVTNMLGAIVVLVVVLVVVDVVVVLVVVDEVVVTFGVNDMTGVKTLLMSLYVYEFAVEGDDTHCIYTSYVTPFVNVPGISTNPVVVEISAPDVYDVTIDDVDRFTTAICNVNDENAPDVIAIIQFTRIDDNVTIGTFHVTTA